VGVGEEAAKKPGGVLAAGDGFEDVIPRSGGTGEDHNEDLN
jgi:hypothetical protein